MITVRFFASFLASACFMTIGCTLATGDSTNSSETVIDFGDDKHTDDGGLPGTSDGGTAEKTGIITGNGAVLLTPELITLYAPLGKLLTEADLTPALLDGSDLVATLGGRTFLHYMIKCALPAGKAVTITHAGVTITLEGAIGLAPEWETGALSTSSQRWLSACLLAHVNATGTVIPILLAGDHPALGTGGTDEFPLREGAFYGNIFDLSLSMYACTGSGQKQVCGSGASKDLKKRACARGMLGPGISVCGFVVPGFCYDALLPDTCDEIADGAYRGCHGSLLQSPLQSPSYDEVITVYLKSDSAPPTLDACK